MRVYNCVMYSYRQIRIQEKKDEATKTALKVVCGAILPIHIILSPITYTIKEIIRRTSPDDMQIPYTPFYQYILEPFSGNRIDTYVNNRDTGATSMRRAVEKFEQDCEIERENAARRAFIEEQQRCETERVAKLTTPEVINLRNMLKNSISIIVEPDRAGQRMVLDGDVSVIFINGISADMDAVIDFHDLGHRMAARMIVVKDKNGRRFELNDDQVHLVVKDISNAIIAYKSHALQKTK